MADGDAGARPQAFVLDTQSDRESRQRNQATGPRGGQQALLLLVGMVVLALVIQGVFIYDLYSKTKALSLNRSHPHYQDMSDLKTSAHQVGAAFTSQGGTTDQKQEEQRPFAHLTGTNATVGEKNVVQWTSSSNDAVTRHMSYSNGCLRVEREGYYYLYSKVHLLAVQNCSLIMHKVMKHTSAYGDPIQLMRSNSFRCRLSKHGNPKTVWPEALWNSYLGGIFHLQSGDKIYVVLDNVQGNYRPGSTDNFMGAFMIVPWTH